MPKLKVSEDGSAVIQDGHPVYVYEDGAERPFDIDSALTQITTLNAEAKNHRLGKEEALKKLEPFEGIDPESAKKAISTISNLDAKKLIDAGEVETLKKQMGEIFEKEKADLIKGNEQKVTTLEDEKIKLTSQLWNLAIKNNFAQSPYFSGPEPKTILPPDMAAEYFGKHFKVEGEDDIKVVGYMNGDKIPSRIKVGEIADFEEAISAIIDKYPMKDRILRAASGGSGSPGNLNQGGDGRFVSLSKIDSKDTEKYRAAKAKSVELGIPLRLET